MKPPNFSRHAQALTVPVASGLEKYVGDLTGLTVEIRAFKKFPKGI